MLIARRNLFSQSIFGPCFLLLCLVLVIQKPNQIQNHELS